jgi:Ca2+-dependent lipid-binding protein
MMGKYATLESHIFSIFGTSEWIAESIKTYPQSYIKTETDREFIRVAILSSGSGLNLNSVSGILQIEIYIAGGQGPSRASIIADSLDSYLVGKSKETGSSRTQFAKSVLTPVGKDKENPTLYRFSYSLNFSHYGVN